jgi:hypothetical protein
LPRRRRDILLARKPPRKSSVFTLRWMKSERAQKVDAEKSSNPLLLSAPRSHFGTIKFTLTNTYIDSNKDSTQG